MENGTKYKLVYTFSHPNEVEVILKESKNLVLIQTPDFKFQGTMMDYLKDELKKHSENRPTTPVAILIKDPTEYQHILMISMFLDESDFNFNVVIIACNNTLEKKFVPARVFYNSFNWSIRGVDNFSILNAKSMINLLN